MNRILLFLFTTVTITTIYTVNGHNGGCPNRAFLGCILALKEEHVNFDRNIVRFSNLKSCSLKFA